MKLKRMVSMLGGKVSEYLERVNLSGGLWPEFFGVQRRPVGVVLVTVPKRRRK